MHTIALLLLPFCLPCAKTRRGATSVTHRHWHHEQNEEWRASIQSGKLHAKDHNRQPVRKVAMLLLAFGSHQHVSEALIAGQAGTRHRSSPAMLHLDPSQAVPQENVPSSPVATQKGTAVRGNPKISGLTRGDLLRSLALVGASSLNPKPASAIVGGVEVPDAQMARRGLVGVVVGDTGLLRQRKGFCTGTLLDAERGLVLTARHCVLNPLSELTYVVFSSDLFSKDAVRRTIVDMRVNDDVEGDLAILRFEGEVPLDYRPVTLITALKSSYTTEDNLTIYGFGQQRDDQPTYRPVGLPGMLKKMKAKLTMPVDGTNPIIITQPSNEDEGQCFGDSGGPAFVPTCLESPLGAMLRDAIDEPRPTGLAQLGVLSQGPDQCTGVTEDYVNLADYRNWIKNAVEELGGKLQEVLPQ